MITSRNGWEKYDDLCRICELIVENRQKAESFDRLMAQLNSAKKAIVTNYIVEDDKWSVELVEREVTIGHSVDSWKE